MKCAKIKIKPFAENDKEGFFIIQFLYECNLFLNLGLVENILIPDTIATRLNLLIKRN